MGFTEAWPRGMLDKRNLMIKLRYSKNTGRAQEGGGGVGLL